MNNEEKCTKIQEHLDKKQDLFKCLSVMDVNHKPHPYMIGSRHVVHASDNHGGMLGKTTLETVPCAHPGCNTDYDQHTSDNVAFLQHLRDGTNDEANKIMKAMVKAVGETLVDGFTFVETKEKFRIK